MFPPPPQKKQACPRFSDYSYHCNFLFPSCRHHDLSLILNVPQSFPGTADFTQGIKPFNLRLPFTPVALAIPSTVAQVQAAVSCARKLGLKISPRSGGHNYASHGIGGEDGHLVIDMKLFNNVAVDKATNVASIGPGARLETWHWLCMNRTVVHSVMVYVLGEILSNM
jgi:hypothetical protein